MTDQLDPHTYSAPDAASRPPFDWRWMIAIGAVMLVGGLLAFAFPFLASLTVTAIAGAAFLLAGIMQVWAGWSHRQDDAWMRTAHGLLGLALVVLGVVLLADPLSGLVSLTLTVGLLFIVFGVLRGVIALRMRGRSGWGWALASAAVSVALGVLVLATLPGSAASLLGVLLGVDLVMSGTAAIVLALRLRRA
ncbi:HdeD family acid-resistance protein [Anianabacter salinae]|uniref:HdeD family acid-resistance protein n=1 Tax=Anianabacter salinae TaxID=2851023 RepID=UPI00225E531F|nr:DUF308 domain-containing protein [Anianabacter salinae]MBV0913400.1 DUF308 domain-containing protein [Anianabacter salinae]